MTGLAVGWVREPAVTSRLLAQVRSGPGELQVCRELY